MWARAVAPVCGLTLLFPSKQRNTHVCNIGIAELKGNLSVSKFDFPKPPPLALPVVLVAALCKRTCLIPAPSLCKLYCRSHGGGATQQKSPGGQAVNMPGLAGGFQCGIEASTSIYRQRGKHRSRPLCMPPSRLHREYR